MKKLFYFLVALNLVAPYSSMASNIGFDLDQLLKDPQDRRVTSTSPLYKSEKRSRSVYNSGLDDSSKYEHPRKKRKVTKYEVQLIKELMNLLFPFCDDTTLSHLSKVYSQTLLELTEKEFKKRSLRLLLIKTPLKYLNEGIVKKEQVSYFIRKKWRAIVEGKLYIRFDDYVKPVGNWVDQEEEKKEAAKKSIYKYKRYLNDKHRKLEDFLDDFVIPVISKVRQPGYVYDKIKEQQWNNMLQQCNNSDVCEIILPLLCRDRIFLNLYRDPRILFQLFRTLDPIASSKEKEFSDFVTFDLKYLKSDLLTQLGNILKNLKDVSTAEKCFSLIKKPCFYTYINKTVGWDQARRIVKGAYQDRLHHIIKTEVSESNAFEKCDCGVFLEQVGNVEEAKKYYQMAAKEGFGEACYRLYLLLKKRKWLVSSAEKGYAPAQTELGIEYIEQRRFYDGVRYLKKAHKQGFKRASYLLGWYLNNIALKEKKTARKEKSKAREENAIRKYKEANLYNKAAKYYIAKEFSKAWTLAKEGKVEGAKKILKSMLSYGSKFLKGQKGWLYGWILEKEGFYKKAYNWYLYLSKLKAHSSYHQYYLTMAHHNKQGSCGFNKNEAQAKKIIAHIKEIWKKRQQAAMYKGLIMLCNWKEIVENWKKARKDFGLPYALSFSPNTDDQK